MEITHRCSEECAQGCSYEGSEAQAIDQMTINAREAIEEWGEDGPDSVEDAAVAFRNVYGRDPEGDEWDALWSHVCAAAK